MAVVEAAALMNGGCVSVTGLGERTAGLLNGGGAARALGRARFTRLIVDCRESRRDDDDSVF